MKAKILFDNIDLKILKVLDLNKKIGLTALYKKSGLKSYASFVPHIKKLEKQEFIEIIREKQNKYAEITDEGADLINLF